MIILVKNKEKDDDDEAHIICDDRIRDDGVFGNSNVWLESSIPVRQCLSYTLQVYVYAEGTELFICKA